MVFEVELEPLSLSAACRLLVVGMLRCSGLIIFEGAEAPTAARAATAAALALAIAGVAELGAGRWYWWWAGSKWAVA